MELLGTLLKLEKSFNVRIVYECNNQELYKGKVEDIPFSFIKLYCLEWECDIVKICKDSMGCDMTLLIKSERLLMNSEREDLCECED